MTAPTKIRASSRPSIGWDPFFSSFVFVCLLGGLWIIFLHLTQPKPPAPLEIKSYFGKVMLYSLENQQWERPNRGDLIKIGDILRTGADSEVDLKVGDALQLRIKENTEISLRPTSMLDRNPTYQLFLADGKTLISATDPFEGQTIKVITPKGTYLMNKGDFLVEGDGETSTSWLGVLRGKAYLETGFLSQGQPVLALQKSTRNLDTGRLEITKVSREEWNQMKEVYELSQKSAAVEAEQLDLSQHAGNFFEYVIDHGTFFTPKIGNATREFIREKETSEKTYLEVGYDVFPRGSYVGIYFKTRDLDLSKFESLTLKTRRKLDEEFPKNIRMEIKGKGGILRAYALKNFTNDWLEETFDLHIKVPTIISEITLVVSNDKVGEAKQGYFQLSEISLIPAKKQAVAVDPEEVVAPKGASENFPELPKPLKTPTVSPPQESLT